MRVLSALLGAACMRLHPWPAAPKPSRGRPQPIRRMSLLGVVRRARGLTAVQEQRMVPNSNKAANWSRKWRQR